MKVLEQSTDLKFITLTLKADSKPLTKQLKHLKDSFRRLRQQKVWTIAKGYAVIEITYNLKTDAWHPHLHIICQGKYIPKDKLVEAWRKASKGSFIVDIRAIKDKAHAANYLTSYMAKMDKKDAQGKLQILSWPIERLTEWYKSLKCRRLVLKFGNWPAVPENPAVDETTKPDDWEIIGSVEELSEQVENPVIAALLQEYGYLELIQRLKGAPP